MKTSDLIMDELRPRINEKMKTSDLILMELSRIDKIVLKELAERIDKKLDTTSHAVKKLVKEGFVTSERVHLGRSYNTFVWLNNKNGQLENNKIQVESKGLISSSNPTDKTLANNNILDHNQKTFQVDTKINRRIYENNNIQLENDKNPFDFADTPINLQNTKGRLKLPLEKLRSIYWDITIDKNTGKGKTDRHNKNKLIDKIIREIDFQRGD